MFETTRVVVTGRGALTPVGNTWPETWDGLKNGRSGIATIASFDPSNLETKFAGEIKGFEARDHFEVKDARRLPRCVQIAVVAARQALAESGVQVTEENTERIAVVVGSGIAAAMGIADQTRVYDAKGPRRVSPLFIPMALVDSPAGQIAIDLNIKGLNMAVVTACATGTTALGEAAYIIKRGDADVVLCGGTESAISPLSFCGFNVMNALSTRNDDPAAACRPFDAARDGFVISEGTAILVVESEEHARARGARIYGEVLGYGCAADATHFAAPDAEAGGIVRSMRGALRTSHLGVKDIQYINAHGTGTKLNDLTETFAVKQVFGEQAYHVPMSSTKSMIGHMLGASGAVEALVCLTAINDSLIPPTINYSVPDPECDLDCVPNQARPVRVDIAMSNSMGLGGHNASVIVGRYN